MDLKVNEVILNLKSGFEIFENKKTPPETGGVAGKYFLFVY